MWGRLQTGKTPPAQQADPVAVEFGIDQWRGFPYGTAPQEQIGIYGAIWLNQYPAYYNQPQLHSAVEWLDSRYLTPAAYSPQGAAIFQTATRPGIVAGGQRYGQNPGPLVGPLSAKASSARVAAAQLRQSGAAALSWAEGLTGG